MHYNLRYPSNLQNNFCQPQSRHSTVATGLPPIEPLLNKFGLYFAQPSRVNCFSCPDFFLCIIRQFRRTKNPLKATYRNIEGTQKNWRSLLEHMYWWLENDVKLVCQMTISLKYCLLKTHLYYFCTFKFIHVPCWLI